MIQNTNKIILIIILSILMILGFSLTINGIIKGFKENRDLDIHRRWKTAQYVINKKNPYAIASEILKEKYGDNPRINGDRISAMPEDIQNKELITDIGAPEPVYPPPALVLFSVFFGFIPLNLVSFLWTFLNIIILLGIVYYCLKPVLKEKRNLGYKSVILVIFLFSLILIWPPTNQVFERGQFGLLLVFMLILLLSIEKEKPVLNGIIFTVLLIKPSITLPFLLILIIKKEWKSLSVVVAIQALLTLVLSLILSANPIEIITDWFFVSGFFTEGVYSIQEIIRFVPGIDSKGEMIISLVFLAVCILWIIINKNKRSDPQVVLFLSIVSVLWTYHATYDFIIFLVPFYLISTQFAGRLTDNVRKGEETVLIIGITLFVFIGLALYKPIFFSEYMIFRIVRWMGRISLFLLFLLSAFLLRWTVKDIPFFYNNTKKEHSN